MKKTLSLIGIVASFAILAGCTGSGTTYGTGTSHEEDTFKSVVNLLAITPEQRKKIDYSARPELVMPANKQALPTPAENAQSQDENWPVSPEQRIAEIRENAPEVDERSSALPIEFEQSEKLGINKTGNSYLARATRQHDKNLHTFDSKEVSEEVRKRRQELAYSTGANRKYLTEPPSEYRVPSANAEAGDAGFTKEELEAIKEEKQEDERSVR